MSGINMGISVYETKDGGLAMKQETFFAVNDNSFQILVSFSPRGIRMLIKRFSN